MQSKEIHRQEPTRVISGFPAFAIVAGSMLGIGIFLSPPIVAANSPGFWSFLAMWILGGLVALAGAAACAELATMIPEAGGDYVFQREAFGPSVAFASGCVLFGAIFCGSIATLSVGVATYQLPHLLGLDLNTALFTLPWGPHLRGTDLAALIIVTLITLLNLRGASESAKAQSMLILLPISCFVALAFWALGFAEPAPRSAGPHSAPTLGFRSWTLSYMAVYFAYSGWINVIYVAGEVINPERNIPRALLGGTLVVTGLYLLLCSSFVAVLGMKGLAQAGEAGTALGLALMGERGQLLVTLLIATALLATINGTVLGGARVAYAMALDGALWSWLSKTDQRGVPAPAIVLQGGLAMVLILSGRFDQLYTMVSLAMVVTGTLTVGSLFVLRRTRAHEGRPYRALGYPWLPALYVVAAGVVIAVMLGDAVSGTEEDWLPLLGLGILAAAYIGHRLTTGRQRPQTG